MCIVFCLLSSAHTSVDVVMFVMCCSCIICLTYVCHLHIHHTGNGLRPPPQTCANLKHILIWYPWKHLINEMPSPICLDASRIAPSGPTSTGSLYVQPAFNRLMNSRLSLCTAGFLYEQPAFNRLMNSWLMNSMHMFTDVVGKYKRKHTHVLSSICTGHPLVYIYIYRSISLYTYSFGAYVWVRSEGHIHIFLMLCMGGLYI